MADGIGGGYTDPTAGSGFGSGLAFGGGDAAPVDAAPGADVPPTAPQAPPATAPQASGGFGSGLRSILPGPNYTAPDPQLSALDQSADMLQQRVKRANEVASNPILQFFNPEGVQKARDFAPQAAEKLQQIRVQQAAIVAGKQQAQTLGLAPGEISDEATQADRVEAAKAKALSGNLNSFQGLAAVAPEVAASIQDRVHEVTAGHLTKAQFAFDKLSNMRNQGEYAAAVQSLRVDGTLTDLEALGMKVPPSFDAFGASKASEGKALREARIGVENIGARIAERGNGVPMEKKEAETYAGRLTTEAGDDLAGGNWQRINGKRVYNVNGMGDINDLGKKFAVASPEARKSIEEDAKRTADPKDIEKFRANNRLYGMATTTRDGTPIPSTGLSDGKGGKIYINDNPNVQQGIAEGLASALRGGLGGATAGLLGIETSKRGYVQSLLDKVAGAYGGAVNTLSGEKLRPYLTQMTQQQQRDVLDYLKAYNKTDVADRLTQTAERAGQLGLKASALGFGEHEAGPEIDAAIERGRQSTIARFKERQRATNGGDGGIYLDEPPSRLVTDTGPQQPVKPVPPPVQQTQSPQASQPGLAPIPPAGPQPAPAGGPPPAAQAPQQGTPPALQPGPASGGNVSAPITIAGQQVSAPPLPPGASPQYLAKTQRIESGGEKDPWKAGAGNGPDGKPLSSAKGAFQFINSTWAADKPPGAPDNPAEATPQQQADAAAARATKNAAVLTKSGIPVNDTNLYITHNLGEGAGPKLLNADPTADARTVVGERSARNNPLFFRGKPTVATVLARYDAKMNEPEPTKPQPGSGGAATGAEQPPTFMQRLSRTFMQGVPGSGVDKDKAAAEVGNAAVEHAPAIGSTLGAIGGAAGGPVGAVAGGAVGGGAGQSFKDYMQGRSQNPTEIAKQTLLGGVLGVASEARPFLAGATRVIGSSVVEGGATAAEGGNVADIAEAGAKGGGLALGGEALGKFITALGPAAHKLFSKFTPDAQAELSAQAGKLVEARKVLASEQPKLAGEGAGPNPKFEAAKEAEEKASQYIKDHGQKPDDMAYAYEQTKSGVSHGEAAVMRGAAGEKSAIGAGYDQLREDVRGATPGQKNLKPQNVPDGPVSMLRTGGNPTGKVPEAFRADAEHAEMLVTAPAKDWGAKWQQLQDAGSELIKKRMSFLANNDKPSAEAMNALFEGVRNQQKAAAKIVFGEKRGAEVITHLEDLDRRYAKVMNATQGMNFEKMRSVLAEGNTPARRELENNFKEFAKDDPSALRAFNAMKAGARGDWKSEASLMAPVIAGEVAANLHGIPTVGVISALVGGHRLYKMVQGYMNAKVLGKPVTFKDFLANEIKSDPAAMAAANAAQRAVVMQ